MAQNNKNNEQDIHDRHPDPNTEGESKASAAPEKSNSKTKFNWPGKDAKEQQAARDAHFKENGVGADLTGGKVPGEE